MAVNSVETLVITSVGGATNSYVLDKVANAENAQVEIFDSLGKKIFSDKDFNSNIIETSQFSSGLYFVKIQKEGKTAAKKMIKN